MLVPIDLRRVMQVLEPIEAGDANGIASKEQTRVLEKAWAEYPRRQRLDVEGCSARSSIPPEFQRLLWLSGRLQWGALKALLAGITDAYWYDEAYELPGFSLNLSHAKWR